MTQLIGTGGLAGCGRDSVSGRIKYIEIIQMEIKDIAGVL